MSRTFTEEEISELKESRFAASGTSRSRILSVLDLLVRFTDERTGISASEIARVIGICSEKPTSENAILKDLHQISESMPMGIRVAIPGHGENVGFRAVNKPLSSKEAILISDVLGRAPSSARGRKTKSPRRCLHSLPTTTSTKAWRPCSSTARPARTLMRFSASSMPHLERFERTKGWPSRSRFT